MNNVHIVAVGMDGSTVYPNNALESAHFIYLHGKLEDANQYDICMFIKGTKPKEGGIYDCNVHMTDGSIVPSKLYLYPHIHVTTSFRGLVISNFEDYDMIQEVVKNHVDKTAKYESEINK